jgi:phage terminase large subunit-like protein
MSMPSSPGFPAPRWATARTDRASHGAAVASVAEALGQRLMGWQRFVADVSTEREGEQLAYRDVSVSVPRQQGKSTVILALVVHRMLASRSRVVYGAQNRTAARSKLLDTWWPRLSRSRLGELFSISRVNGGESLRSSNGSLLTLLSDQEASGHGESIDLGVIDEAWAVDARAEQSVRPALLARSNGQILRASTAGTMRSVYWKSKIDGGRTAVEVV